MCQLSSNATQCYTTTRKNKLITSRPLAGFPPLPTSASPGTDGLLWAE